MEICKADRRISPSEQSCETAPHRLTILTSNYWLWQRLKSTSYDQCIRHGMKKISRYSTSGALKRIIHGGWRKNQLIKARLNGFCHHSICKRLEGHMTCRLRFSFWKRSNKWRAYRTVQVLWHKTAEMSWILHTKSGCNHGVNQDEAVLWLLEPRLDAVACMPTTGIQQKI